MSLPPFLNTAQSWSLTDVHTLAEVKLACCSETESGREQKEMSLSPFNLFAANCLKL